jgi:hypothetical protein
LLGEAEISASRRSGKPDYLAVFRTGTSREPFPHSISDILNFVADLPADFFAAGWGEQQSCADSNADAGYECEQVADGMVISRVKVRDLITNLVAQVGDALAGTIHAIGDPTPYIAREVVRLVEEIYCGLQNGTNQVVHQSPPFIANTN